MIGISLVRVACYINQIPDAMDALARHAECPERNSVQDGLQSTYIEGRRLAQRNVSIHLEELRLGASHDIAVLLHLGSQAVEWRHT